MQFERLYHNAASTAEGPFDTERAASSHCSAVTLLQNAFPQALEASAYALRKRLICPRWWLVGVISQWMTKDLETLSKRIGLSEDDFVFAGPAINAKNFPLVAALWTELLAQVSASSFESQTVELNLRRILRGTSAEVFEQREFLTHYLSAALRIQKVKFSVPKCNRSRSKSLQNKNPQLTAESVGLVQIFENVILSETDSQKLYITFAKCPRKLFSSDLNELLPAALQPKCGETQVRQYSSAFVTLQPDVLQAISRSLSPKKLIPYLSLEITKSEIQSASNQEMSGLPEGVWRGRSVLSHELTRLHKDELSQSRSLYDHGLLSWENEAPRQRIRALRRESSGKGNGMGTSGIVHCWRLSQHVIDAISFEHALTRHLSSDASVTAQISGPSHAQPLLRANESDALDCAEVESVFPVRRSETGAQKVVASTKTSHEGAEPSRLKATASTERVAQKQPALVISPKSTVSHQGSSSKMIEVCLPEKRPSTHQPQKRVVTFSSQREHQSKDVWSDDEFLMCVAEFYESLTPLQQQAFERERRRMSPEQFKIYVTPALKRFKLSNV